MKTVVGYALGVPNPHKNKHKVDILKRYIDGVQKCGDKGILHFGNNIIDSDVNMFKLNSEQYVVLTENKKYLLHTQEE